MRRYLLVDNTFSSKNQVGRLGMVTRTLKWIGSLEWDVAREGELEQNICFLEHCTIFRQELLGAGRNT